MARRAEQDNLQRWIRAFTAVAKNPSGKRIEYRLSNGTTLTLDQNCHAVWCALVANAKDLRSDRTSSWASIETLADFAFLGTTNTKMALNELTDVGLIQRKRRPNKQSSVTLMSTHRITTPEGWEQKTDETKVDCRTDEVATETANMGDASPAVTEPAPQPKKRANQIKQTEQPDVTELVSLVKEYFDTHETFSSKKKELTLVRCLRTCVSRLGSVIAVYKLLCLVFMDDSEAGAKIAFHLRRSDNLGPYIVTCLGNWYDRHEIRMKEPDTVVSTENTQGVGA